MAEINEAVQPQLCAFMRIPLEIRNEIYRMLLTTPYCTHIAPSGISLEFRLSTNILLANRQISKEAKKMFLEENNFVILKVTGFNLALEDVPTFEFLTEDQITNPVLQAEVKYVAERLQKDVTGPITLITTIEGLQPIINALWKLNKPGTEFMEDYTFVIPFLPSDLGLSLHFSVKAPARCESLRRTVLKPWESLHGIRKLVVTGDTGDHIHQHLHESMLQGPFPTEVAFTLSKHHSMVQNELIQKNFTSAQWWWTLFEGYWKHLGLLRVDFLGDHELRRIKSGVWGEVWTQFKKLYFQGKLEIIKTYLRQFRYKMAIFHAGEAHCECVYPLIPRSGHTVTPVLRAKFYLCEMLAQFALGNIAKAVECLNEGSTYLASSSQYSNQSKHELYKDLELSVFAELAGEVGMGSRTFWGWLDVPEE